MVNEGPLFVSSATELKNKEKQRKKAKSGGFESFGLSLNVFRGVKRKGYKVPTPIQRKTIPLILSGVDVVAMARTGSGKTAAFLVPMFENLRNHCGGMIRALILSPTRDLALQTLKFAKELGRYTDLRISLLVGGDSMESQFKELAHDHPDIIIATPGRLMHLLSEVEDMSLRNVEYVVFDEADCIFSMGFAQQMHGILSHLNDNRQTLLFSATLPSALAEFAKAGLRDHQLVRLDLGSNISRHLKLVFFTLRREEKYAALLYLIEERIRTNEQTMIFVSTKYHVEFLHVLLKEKDFRPSICYGDMDQDARKMNVERFRKKETMLMIVTDVAARGIDIPALDNVINWDFPPSPKLFVHRVGRTARVDRTGTAFSFVTSEDMPHVLDLHLFLSKPIRAAPTEEEVSHDVNNVVPKIDQAIASGETVYGRFPQTILDLYADRVSELLDSSTKLHTLESLCARAFRLYNKTKAKPSKESVRRAKTLPRDGLHPILKSLLGCNEISALAASETLKAYRPKQTILEAEGAVAKSKHLKGSASEGGDVMKKKRAIHDEIINKHSRKRAEKDDEIEHTATTASEKKVSGCKRKVKSFKDEEYFISSVPANHHFEAGLSVKGNGGFESNRLDAAVLDLAADDSSGLQKQKTQYHWDKRSKKYIKLNSGDRVTASGKVKTESGAKVKANKTGIYKRWKERTHNTISSQGTSYDGSAEEPMSTAGGRGQMDSRRFKGGKQRQFIPNAHVRSELKNNEQIRKERQKKATKLQQLKNNRNRGKKFGK